LTISIDELVLTTGKHKTRKHGLCVMEAVAWVAGENHTDMPKCVSPAITRYMQVMNDCGETEVHERLKPYIYKVIGTKGDDLLEQARGFIAADFAVRVFAANALDAANQKGWAVKLRNLAQITSRKTAEDAAHAAARTAAHATYAARTANAAAHAAAKAAAHTAAHAAYAAHAANAAAHAAHAAHAANAAYAAHAAANASRAEDAAHAAAHAAAHTGTDVWDDAFRCLDTMLWPIPPSAHPE